jgi:hypothetical protein
MKTGFKDRTEVKEGKKIKSPWNFDQPPYDERSSCFVNAGTNYGVGHKQPIGHTDNPKSNIIPKGRVNTLKTDYVHKGKVSNVEIDEEA